LCALEGGDVDQGTLVLGGIALLGIVIGSVWLVALRLRSGSWYAAQNRHPTQVNLAMALASALGACGVITIANPEGTARLALGLIAVALVLANLGVEAWRRTHRARG
jgi:hypothetical protein